MLNLGFGKITNTIQNNKPIDSAFGLKALKTDLIKQRHFEQVNAGKSISQRDFEHPGRVLRFLVGFWRGHVAHFLNLQHQRTFKFVALTGRLNLCFKL